MKKKRIIAWSLFLFWLALIFFFSSQTGTESSNLSGGVLNIILKIIPSLNLSFFSFAIRKLAHFTEYAILGILTFHLVLQYRNITIKEIILIIVFCIFYASTDEFHQTFVGGRSGQPLDVVIDSLGSIFGVILTDLICRIRKQTR